MRTRSLSVAGACAAALLLTACTHETAGSATPRGVDAPRAVPTPTPGPDPSTVRLPGPPTENGRAALLAPQGDDEVVALLREPTDEAGYLGALVSLGLITPEGPGSGPDEPGVLDESVVPAVGDPVLVATGPDGETTVLVGDVGGAIGALVLTDSVVTVPFRSPALVGAQEVDAVLSPDGEVVYLLVRTAADLAVLLAVGTLDGQVRAEVELTRPGGTRVVPRALAALPDGGVVTTADVVVPGGEDDSTAVLARWDAGLAPIGEQVELAPDEDAYSTTFEVAVLADGTAVALVATGRVAGQVLRLVTATADVVTTVEELPEAIDPGGYAVDAAGATAYLAVRERGAPYATLVVADLGAGTTDTVDLCREGAVDDVAVAADGGVWVSGVCDDDAVVWAVR